ncbi:cytochrome P450 family protein [Thermospira aquatica]|uniref:GWxTD domain-containing protein n=1 Tax=Thermospira aquatica TaxID=2828656 RepID=A0AAX3BEX3_9SPIR|nr:hypothetical protein [Thermospira aquatica]URA10815.1 hypothetical protein KDW03_03145 [Thermospira aquatica]
MQKIKKFTLSLLWLPVILHSYEAKIEVSAYGRELKVIANYRFESDSVTLTLPQRARIQLVQGSNQQIVPLYQNGNVLTFSKLGEMGRQINITYVIPVVADEFFLEDWLPVSSESGRITVSTVAPQGYRFLIFPYERRMESGYILNPEDKPRIVFGRYSVTDDSRNQRVITIASHLKLQIDTSTVFEMLNTLEKLLFPLQVQSIDLITLPAWQGQVFRTSNRIVAILGNTTPDAVKTTLATMYFAPISNVLWRQALIDYYKRTIADDGKPQNDEGFRLHVPSESYYRKILKDGFPSPERVFVDINGMEKNYLLLQFGFFTINEARFHSAVRELLKNPTSQNWDFSPLFEGTNETQNKIVQWLVEKYLPTPSSSPDISIKHPFVYRNFTEVEVSVWIDGKLTPLEWNGNRSFPLSNESGEVNLDPARWIPQWNYANDLWIPPAEKPVWDQIFTVAQNHKLTPTDTTREILYARRFDAPAGNKWNIPAGNPVYVIISRVYTTHQNRMVVAFKELIITVNENKANIVAYRLRL